MIGQTISHYRVAEKLGEGGMGVVYRAHDTRLDRTVALKFLPEQTSDKEELHQRFLREARAAAALNHPNICTVHSVDEHEGRPFISMEYIDGTTLREHLQTQNFKPQTVLDYALHIAEALAEAHEAGIVHRDIKPENIMVDSKNRIKVMDFGLARLKGSLKITQSASTVGTVAYMSPEQIQGEEVDHRADIFSFGVVLFEMLTGRLPFRGEHEAAMMYSIVNEERVSLQTYLPDAPDEFEHLFDRLLAKEADHRIDDSGEVAGLLENAKKAGGPRADQLQPLHADHDSSRSEAHESFSRATVLQMMQPGLRLKIVTGIAVSVVLIALATAYFGLYSPVGDEEHVDPSIAVLPFDNLSPNPDDAYFAGGMHGELISHLSQIPDVRVISRTTMLGYEDAEMPVEEIASELDVGTVMEAEVERVGGRVRIGTRLIDGQTDALLWSENYEGQIGDIHDIRAEVIGKVAEALRTTLSPRHAEALAERSTDNVEAYEAYLEGLDAMGRDVRARLLGEMLAGFQRAVELDPDFAEAWARLALTHLRFYWFGEDPTDARLSQGREAAQKAYDLAPALPIVRLALADAHYRAREYGRALELTDGVLADAPGMPEATGRAGWIYRRQGRWEESTRLLERTVELDPENPQARWNLLINYWALELYRAAAEHADEALALATEIDPAVYGSLGDIRLSLKGDVDAAREVANRFPDRFENDRALLLAWYDATEDDYEAALQRLDDVPDDHGMPHMTPIPAALIKGVVLDGLDQSEQARMQYRSAVRILEEIVEAPGFDPMTQTPYLSVLAYAYAGLGQEETAAHMAERSLEELPVSEDALRGPERMLWKARVQTALGNEDQAIETLEELVSIPSTWSSALRFDPLLQPLHGHEGFEQVIGSY